MFDPSGFVVLLLAKIVDRDGRDWAPSNVALIKEGTGPPEE
jgi:hypothetical protein